MSVASMSEKTGFMQFSVVGMRYDVELRKEHFRVAGKSDLCVALSTSVHGKNGTTSRAFDLLM